MRHLRSIVLLAVVVAVSVPIVAVPSVAVAQRVTVRRDRDGIDVRVRRDRAPSRDVTLGVGVLYDQVTDNGAPMAALRAGWRLRSWLRSELGVSYALADAPLEGTDGDHAHLASAEVGIQAVLPWPLLQPYVGTSLGLAGRFERRDGGNTVRPSIQFPVGIRVPITPRLGVQAEVRWRLDEQRSGASAVNREHTVGLQFGF